MHKPTPSHRQAVPIRILVAFALCLVPASVWGQTPRASGTAPVLTFTPGIASTVAGTGTSGYSGDGGPATQAQFNYPIGIARDGQGNVYIADIANNVIRRISPDGTVTTVAGNGTQGYSGDGGPATSAQLFYPTAVTSDSAGNFYIADFVNACVRKVDTNGIISTLASASGSLVRGVTADGAGNIYFSSSFEGVWKVDSEGVTTKIVGNGTPGFSGDGGPAIDAQTSGVGGLALDQQGNLYLAEMYNSDVRKVDTNGIITTVAGDQQFGYAGDGGPATNARFNGPTDVRVDAASNLYIVDSSNGRVRKVNASGTINTIAGNGNFGYAGDGSLASVAEFAGPAAIALDENGNMLVADTGNNVIRKIRVESTTLDFGTVAVGQTGGPIKVIVSNVGDADLNVSNVAASASFGVQSACVATSPLSPGSECSVDVSFTPTLSGNIPGIVTVRDNAAGNPHIIQLEGQGYVDPVPTKLVFAVQFHAMPLNGNLGVVGVTATDASGNLATGFNGVINLQLQGPAGFTTYGTQVNASSGAATFNLTSVVLTAVGAYTITASSSGLTSAQASFIVTGNPDFTVSMSATSLKVGQSGAGTISARVSPTNGFRGSISLSCSGLPSHSTCSFLPALLAADGSNSALNSVVTISTGVDTASAIQHSNGPFLLATGAGVFSAGLSGFVFAIFGEPSGRRRNRRWRLSQLILMAIILCGGLVGCGTIAPGSSHLTPPGNYTVTITGASTGVSHNSAFTLAVH